MYPDFRNDGMFASPYMMGYGYPSYGMGMGHHMMGFPSHGMMFDPCCGCHPHVPVYYPQPHYHGHHHHWHPQNTQMQAQSMSLNMMAPGMMHN
ncbi:MAG: hypothetical protein ACO1OT_14010 [Heyndrickxia sp.]